jgi:2-methylcitrate dehydratase PrpD
VETIDGRRLEGRVDEPKGDPGNTLSRDEVLAKAIKLATYRHGASAAERARVADDAWRLVDASKVGFLFAGR